MNNANKHNLRALKSLLTKEDIKAISRQVGRSESSVNAVFWTRPHYETEQEILRFAEEKLATLTNLTRRLIFETEPLEISIEEYRRLKSLNTWRSGEAYFLFVDAYTQVSHVNCKTAWDALEWVKIEFSQLLRYKYYLLEFLVTSFSISEHNAAREIIKFYKRRSNNV